jgi:hypothetical protein
VSRIPNVFHFVFGLKQQTEPFHLAFYLCLESCRQVNEPDEIFLYYHYEPYGRYWELIRPHLTLVRVPLSTPVDRFAYAKPAVAQFRYAHQSDFIRLERLLERGGIYADIDTLFVSPFPAELMEKPFVLGREGDLPRPGSDALQLSLCNALIMAEPGAEFGRMWLDEMPNAFDGTWSNHSTILPARLSEQHPETIHVEPKRTFYKHGWTPPEIRTLLQQLDADFEGVVSMHLWSHLWWSKRRTDFSLFHGGKITERRVARGDTTYSAAARRFLPARPGLAERVRRATEFVMGRGR